MKRFFLCLMAASALVSNISAKTTTTAEPVQKDSVRNLRLDDVTIIGNRAGQRTRVAQTNLDSKQIQSMAVATNMPHVLWMTPSLVATSENGTGTGYSYLRIRGTDASRINITLNGIPQNNPESQEMYWVDLPDLASSLQSIQIQRGVGTSANGSGAFGASINMVSKSPGMKPYLESATMVGSYGTFQENVAAGTGVFGNGYSFDLRYSKLVSDGYIRNGWCDHESLMATFAKRFAKAALRFNYIYGKENTGITWEGISQTQFNTDPTYNPAGEKPDGSYYDNQSDNYWQHHFQLFYTQELSNELLLSAGLNYTDGFGYYEEYKQDKSLTDMGLANQTVNALIYSKTDLIRRKNMDNGFYTGNLNLQYKKDNINIQAGSMISTFVGEHFANLLWVEHNANIPANFEWVRNSAQKTDANVFTKAEYAFGKGLNAYVDLQYRYVDYKLQGLDDDDMQDMTQRRVWNFFNPKAGLYWELSPESKFFISVAVAHREPTRADIKDSRKGGSINDIRAEQLKDYELGYTFDNQTVMFSVNIYDMHYTNQLVATGKLNDVGYALMSNVPDSYRRGGEFQIGLKPFKWLQIDANTTLSMNRVSDYTVYFDTYTSTEAFFNYEYYQGAQMSQHFDEMKLPYSPEVIAAFGLTIKPIESISLNFTSKYVGEQYYTNTQNDDLKLPEYNQVNFNATWDFRLFNRAEAQLGLVANNLFSNKYACNAWGYEAHFVNGDPTYTEKGLYVVAPRNYLAKFTVKF